MPVFPKSRLQIQMDEMQSMMIQMQKQIDELTSRVAKFPTPARPRWERKTKPAWELETLTLPQLPGVPRIRSNHLELVPKPGIAHVHLCMSGNEQFVNAYDDLWNKIPEYCGPFRQVGLKVLEAAGDHFEWELVAESA